MRTLWWLGTIEAIDEAAAIEKAAENTCAGHQAARGAGMTRRKGEVDRARLGRQWPITLAVGKVRGLKNSEIVRGFADKLSVAPLTYSLRRGDANFVVFCFAKPEDADAFATRFDGERLLIAQCSIRISKQVDGSRSPHRAGTTPRRNPLWTRR